MTLSRLFVLCRLLCWSLSISSALTTERLTRESRRDGKRQIKCIASDSLIGNEGTLIVRQSFAVLHLHLSHTPVNKLRMEFAKNSTSTLIIRFRTHPHDNRLLNVVSHPRGAPPQRPHHPSVLHFARTCAKDGICSSRWNTNLKTEVSS